MLFGREYMPEGAGVDPDAPRKKGAVRLLEILSRDLDGIFLSGTLAMLACAPAAMLAVYAPIEKSLHLEEQIQAKREND